MELRHLRYFIAVAEEEHVTRAAARLNIQQPPLSHQIKLLEKELDVNLFQRTSRNIKLNSAGRIFLDDAIQILQAVDDAVARVRLHDLGEEGFLRIGFTSSASMHQKTRDLIRNYQSKFPRVTIKVEEGTNYDLIEKINHRELDLAFIRSTIEPEHPSLNCTCIDLEDILVVMPRDHALANDDGPVRLSKLADDRFVLYRQIHGSGIAEMTIRACQRSGFTPRITNETSRMISAIQMVSVGFGITLVPASLSCFQSPEIQYRKIPKEEGFLVPLNLVSRKEIDNNVIHNFLSFVGPEQ